MPGASFRPAPGHARRNACFLGRSAAGQGGKGKAPIHPQIHPPLAGITHRPVTQTLHPIQTSARFASATMALVSEAMLPAA